jgi:uncharacterized membrane protein YfcA
LFYIVIPSLLFLVALVAPIIGSGGGPLNAPILYWAGLNFKTQAIPLSLLLSIITTVTAGINYMRHKLVRFDIGLPVMIVAVFMAPLGATMSALIKQEVLIIIFAALDFVAGFLVLTGWMPVFHIESKRWKWIIGLFVGGTLAFLAGLIGRAGGPLFILLLLVIGYEGREAAATGIVIAACSSITGFVGHIPHMQMNWPLAIISIIAVFIGSQIGSHFMIRKVSNKNVKRAFSILLLLVATKLIFDALHIMS